MSRTLGTIFTALASFSAGVAVGLLITPQSGKDNRRWISEHSAEAKDWVEGKSHKILEQSEKKLGKIQHDLKDSIPDLYEATESLLFDESDMKDVS
jgi:gas vesicle protein